MRSAPSIIFNQVSFVVRISSSNLVRPWYSGLCRYGSDSSFIFQLFHGKIHPFLGCSFGELVRLIWGTHADWKLTKLAKIITLLIWPTSGDNTITSEMQIRAATHSRYHRLVRRGVAVSGYEHFIILAMKWTERNYIISKKNKLDMKFKQKCKRV